MRDTGARGLIEVRIKSDDRAGRVPVACYLLPMTSLQDPSSISMANLKVLL